MNLVIDTNIVISALINPDGIIAKFIIDIQNKLNLFAPHYLYTEILNKIDKILTITGYSKNEALDLIRILIKKIEFIDEYVIPKSTWKNAYLLTKDIDEKDTVFIALAMYLKFSLWTGDKKLIKSLKEKGFINIIDTSELKNKI